jgi:hypothetical protein
MARLVRAVDEDESGEVMALAGERGMVTLHLPGGHPECMIIHSPAHIPGFTGPHPCTRMEMPCWCLSSLTGGKLSAVMELGLVSGDEEGLWRLMEMVYHLYLERGRR